MMCKSIDGPRISKAKFNFSAFSLYFRNHHPGGWESPQNQAILFVSFTCTYGDVYFKQHSLTQLALPLFLMCVPIGDLLFSI